MTDWGYREGTLGYKSWYRSFRQMIECPLGEDITLRAHIEEVRLYVDGHVEKRHVFDLTIPMSTISQEEYPDAVAIQTAMTSLIGNRTIERLIELGVLTPVDPPPPEA